MLVAGTILFYNKDKIITLCIQEVNKHLAVEVQVKEIDLSFWDTFPEVSVHLSGIKIDDKFDAQDNKLLEANHIYLSFDAKKLLKGELVFNKLKVDEANTHIKILRNGDANYNIFKSDTSKPENSNVTIDIKEVVLSKCKIKVDNQIIDHQYDFFTPNSAINLDLESNTSSFKINGLFDINAITIEKSSFFQERKVELITHFSYNHVNENLLLFPTSIKVGKGLFDVKGAFTAESEKVDLEISGKNTTILSLLSLLPSSYVDQLSSYKSSGDIYFNGKIKGSLLDTHGPAVSFNFGCKNASFYHPEIDKKVSSISLIGNLEMKNGIDILELKNCNAILDQKKINGDIYIRNFDDPLIELNLNADFDLESINKMFPIDGIKDPRGLITSEFHFKGKISDLKKKELNKSFDASGEITLSNINFYLDNRPYKFDSLNGSMLFNKNDIAFNEFKGKIGKSDFKLNGTLQNFIPFLIGDQQPVFLSGDGKINTLILDELLKTNTTSDSEYSLSIEKHITTDIDLKINEFSFGNFKATNIATSFQQGDGKIDIKTLKMNTSNGIIDLKAQLLPKKQDYFINSQIDLQDIDINKLFTSFNNFGQKFIIDKNLKGSLTSLINLNFSFNKNLEIIAKSIDSEADIMIKNGQLLDFDPMQQLSKFIKRSELSNIKFATLKNKIFIKDEIITIPEMEIKSNINSLNLYGSHTFDQKINYHIKVSLKDFFDKDRDEKFGEIEDVQKGETSLFLIIEGTTDDFTVKYDKKAVKKKIKEGWRKEKEELLNAIKNKGNNHDDNQELELDTARYFDEGF